MTLPNDPQKLVDFYMYMASARTLTSVFDLITEIQTFHLDQEWPVDSAEYKATANTLEALKRLVIIKHNKMQEKAEQLLD